MKPLEDTAKDQRDLDLLGIFHFAMAAIAALGGSVPVIHLFIGITMVRDPAFMTGGRGAPPPFNPGWIFVILGGSLIVLGWTMAFLILFSGISLRQRRRYWLSFVLACIMCLNVPLGTALGVFTLLVLSRQSVKQLYGIAPG